MKLKITAKMSNYLSILLIVLTCLEILSNLTEAKSLINKIESNMKNNNNKFKYENEFEFEFNLTEKLRDRLLDQETRHKVAEEDHRRMEKWLVDNINDLHRELKQTELDFEHYAQVTKIILARNEHQIRQHVASIAMQPLVVESNRIF